MILTSWWRYCSRDCEKKGKEKGRALDIVPQVDIVTTKAFRYMAHTKQRHTSHPQVEHANH